MPHYSFRWKKITKADDSATHTSFEIFLPGFRVKPFEKSFTLVIYSVSLNAYLFVTVNTTPLASRDTQV
jgi:hypothetical protein